MTTKPKEELIVDTTESIICDLNRDYCTYWDTDDIPDPLHGYFTKTVHKYMVELENELKKRGFTNFQTSV